MNEPQNLNKLLFLMRKLGQAGITDHELNSIAFLPVSPTINGNYEFRLSIVFGIKVAELISGGND